MDQGGCGALVQYPVNCLVFPYTKNSIQQVCNQLFLPKANARPDCPHILSTKCPEFNTHTAGLQWIFFYVFSYSQDFNTVGCGSHIPRIQLCMQGCNQVLLFHNPYFSNSITHHANPMKQGKCGQFSARWHDHGGVEFGDKCWMERERSHCSWWWDESALSSSLGQEQDVVEGICTPFALQGLIQF